MNLEEAIKRIEELERKVKELEASSLGAQHYHYHYPSAVPRPAPLPTWPYFPNGPVWACGAGVNAAAGAGALKPTFIGTVHAPTYGPDN